MLNYRMAKIQAAQIEVKSQVRVSKGRRKLWMTRLNNGVVGFGHTAEVSKSQAEFRAAKLIMQNANSGRMVILSPEVLDRIDEKLEQIRKRQAKDRRHKHATA